VCVCVYHDDVAFICLSAPHSCLGDRHVCSFLSLSLSVSLSLSLSLSLSSFHPFINCVVLLSHDFLPEGTGLLRCHSASNGSSNSKGEIVIGCIGV
jgi:hypothetical protein